MYILRAFGFSIALRMVHSFLCGRGRSHLEGLVVIALEIYVGGCLEIMDWGNWIYRKGYDGDCLGV